MALGKLLKPAELEVDADSGPALSSNACMEGYCQQRNAYSLVLEEENDMRSSKSIISCEAISQRTQSLNLSLGSRYIAL